MIKPIADKALRKQKAFLSSKWPHVKWFAHKSEASAENREKKRADKQLEERLADEIERMARESKAGFLSVRNYKKKMIGPAINARTYIEQNLTHIPDPIVLDPSQRHSNPVLNALFAEGNSIRKLLEASKTLQSFFSQKDTSQAVALMTAKWKQKTIMGTDASGGIVRRDVPQQAYYFEDHQISEVSATLDEAREGLCNQILGALIVKVVMEIKGWQDWRKDIQTEREMLELFVEHPARVDPVTDSQKSETHMAEVKQLLADMNIQEQNLKTQIGNPESQLKKVIQTLLNPQPFFSIQPVSLHLNQLGIQVKQPSDEPTIDVTLAKCKLVDQAPTAVLWILAYH